MFKRIIVVTLGSFLMGLALGLCLLSNLGADPLSVLWDGLSRQTGISVGMISMILNILMIIIVFFIDRKQIHVGTIIAPLATSIAIDLVMTLTLPTAFGWRFLIVLFAVITVGFCSAVVASAHLGKAAYDALCYGIEMKTEIPLMYCRYGLDALFLLGGFLCGGVIGIGTLLSLLLIGPVMQYSRDFLKKIKFFQELINS